MPLFKFKVVCDSKEFRVYQFAKSVKKARYKVARRFHKKRGCSVRRLKA